MKFLTPAKLSLLMFVVIAGLVAAYIGKRLFADVEEQPQVETRNVPMPIAELQPGTVITEEHLGQGPIRRSKMESDMLLTNRVIVGRVVKETIPAATPIRSSQLYQPGEFPSLQVGEGMRAVSVGVGTTVAMVDGLIKPGEYVDVHLTPNERNDERTGGGLTLTLFEGVKVMAINRNFHVGDPEQGGNNVVTFELTPKQANILILAREKGLLTLTYNPEGPGDGGVTVEGEDRATLEEILGLESPEPPFAAEQYRGGRRSVLRFRDGRRVDDARGSGRSRRTPQPPSGGNPNAGNNSGSNDTGQPGDGQEQPQPVEPAPSA